MTEEQLLDIKRKLPELAAKAQWVTYKLEEAKDKEGNTKYNEDGTVYFNKRPFNPKTGEGAKANDPETWGTIDQAFERLNKNNLDGLGFELSHGVYYGIDIDHAIDPKTGEINPVALDIISSVDSYTEISPSGMGFHILCKGQPKLKNNKKKLLPPLELEMYCPSLDEKGKLKGGRYLTVTGNIYGDKRDIEERTEQGQIIHDKYLLPGSNQDKPKAQESSSSVVTPKPQSSLSDYDIIQKAMNGKNGARFWALWNGDISGYEKDHSKATLALVNDLCYWTNGDKSQIDHLFRQSVLYRTMKIEGGINKWDKVHSHGMTYGEMTINKALEDFEPYVPEDDNRTNNQGSQTKEEPKVITYPDIETWSDFMGSPEKMPPVLIENILHEGDRMLLTASSKAGKSMLLLELCVAIAEGRRWLNSFQCEQRKVLYVNLELKKQSVENRVEAIREASGWNIHHSDNLLIWHLRNNDGVLNLEMFFDELIARIKRLGVQVVVIDPIYKLFDGDENNSEHVKMFLHYLNKVERETENTIIYCHHHAKGSQINKDIIDRASGSGVFARDIDSFVDIARANIDNEKGCSYNLDGDKVLVEFNAILRNFKSLDKKFLWFEYPLHWIDDKAQSYIKKRGQKKNDREAPDKLPKGYTETEENLNSIITDPEQYRQQALELNKRKGIK